MIVGKNLTAETAIFCSNFHLPSSIFHHPLFIVFSKQGFVDSFDESGEDFAGAAFDEFAGAVLDHVLDGLGPADRAGELRDQVGLDFFLVIAEQIEFAHGVFHQGESHGAVFKFLV